MFIISGTNLPHVVSLLLLLAPFSVADVELSASLVECPSLHICNSYLSNHQRFNLGATTAIMQVCYIFSDVRYGFLCILHNYDYRRQNYRDYDN